MAQQAMAEQAMAGRTGRGRASAGGAAVPEVAAAAQALYGAVRSLTTPQQATRGRRS